MYEDSSLDCGMAEASALRNDDAVFADRGFAIAQAPVRRSRVIRTRPEGVLTLNTL